VLNKTPHTQVEFLAIAFAKLGEGSVFTRPTISINQFYTALLIYKNVGRADVAQSLSSHILKLHGSLQQLLHEVQ
jgi:hypothetical protein